MPPGPIDTSDTLPSTFFRVATGPSMKPALIHLAPALSVRVIV